LKNIQIIDSADNATFSIFQATDDEFALIFPGDGQDLEIVEDLFARLGEDRASKLLLPLWNRPIHKADAVGIHGTLFYDYERKRKHLPTSKREIDRAPTQINAAERDLYARKRASLT